MNESILSRLDGNESALTAVDEYLAAALAPLRARGVSIDRQAVLRHVMRRENVISAASDRGPAEPPQRKPPVPTPEFYILNADGFISQLQTELTNNVAGYSFQLNQNGSPVLFGTSDWGYAQEPQDTAEKWTTNVGMHVASLSKQITAMAMTKLLGPPGFLQNPGPLPREDLTINPYLPRYWVLGPDVSNITFDLLLTHRSGLAYGSNSSRSDYEYMKEQVAVGALNIGQYSYQNMNFGLCRILLCTIAGFLPPDWLPIPLDAPPELFFLNDVIWDGVTIQLFENYVANNVFTPSGVSGVSLLHEPGNALAYPFPVGTGNGWNSGDLTEMAGAAGFHMSVDELLSVMGTFRRTDAIMTPADAQTMLDAGYGINYTESTRLGTLYAKVGVWETASGQWEQGVLFYLPQDMELVVLVNSPVGQNMGEDYLYSLVEAAYTNNILDI